MTANVLIATNKAVDERKCSSEHLSLIELDAVAGGWSISFGPFKITGGDIVDAGKWVYHHTVG